ncbi:hypothetical protein BDF19DRAFT_410081 [Syncephalis fuscata]|nr:hypothetical protein BDF19DRAFT_410081 [Syncephalis fuscata]
MSTEAWIPYSEREEWSDVTPIAQDDGIDPVCPIAYSQESKRELSDRTLALTEDIISMNPGHYTIWHQCDLQKELAYLKEMADENPKCYQLWHHRQVIIDHMGDASGELTFIEDALEKDAKNFHAWSYRQWIIKTFDLWENEVAFVTRLIDDDIRNNSAWNQRYFCIHFKPGTVTDAQLEEEVDFTLKKIELAPSNESSWNYLIGTIRHRPELLLPQIEPVVYNLLERPCISVPLLSFFVQIYQDYSENSPQERYDKAIWASRCNAAI